jgi:membrane protein
MDRALIKRVWDGFADNDLLTFASTIAFQIIKALVPLLLFCFGLLGALGLDDVYQQDVVPDLRSNVSPAVFEVIDSTVHKVLTTQQTFWLTLGLVLTVWEMSGAVRAIMDVLDRIYCNDRERSKRERYTVSILVAMGGGALLLFAVAIHQVVPALTDSPIGFLRWPIVAIVLYAAVVVLVHFAPSEKRPWKAVSVGSGLVVLAWLGTSAVFGLYVTKIAEYGTIFGNLATVWILFQYLYFAACAFLTGAMVDQVLSERTAVHA